MKQIRKIMIFGRAFFFLVFTQTFFIQKNMYAYVIMKQKSIHALQFTN
jgi:hypothetical protein